MIGSCFCGKVAFSFNEATINNTVLCHCTNCKRITGSLFSTNISVSSSDFEVQGTPKTFSFDSGQGPVFEIFFCGECSCVLWKTTNAPALAKFTILQAGCLKDGCDEFLPDGEIFVGERCAWLKPLEGAQQSLGPFLRAEKAVQDA
ncbi:hypothetical protein IQ07DRAFT_513968 [Pyrenochaeta sp. DS3sAY3a]|nr:hypothetical protein IQ07DRAFT_513968 [Pyrenochaeta sp. DS3sAY3a]